VLSLSLVFTVHKTHIYTKSRQRIGALTV
jgi:hypothetical protein